MNVKEAREAAGLSRREVCELIGVPYRTLQDWELEAHPPFEWVERLVVKEILRHRKKK